MSTPQPDEAKRERRAAEQERRRRDRERADQLDGAWLESLRVALSVALVVVAAFPVFVVDRGEEEFSMWGTMRFLGEVDFSEDGAAGAVLLFGFAYTWLLLIATAILAVVPPSAIGRGAARVLMIGYGCLAGGHLALMLLYLAQGTDGRVTLIWPLFTLIAAGLCFVWVTWRTELEQSV